jgi:hypothetical protein
MTFLRVLVREGMVDPTVLRERVYGLSLPDDLTRAVRKRLSIVIG